MKQITFTIAFLIHVSIGIVNADDENNSLLYSGGDASVMATVGHVAIEVVDQVKDGCLSNPNRLSDKVELVLRNSGIGIIPKDFPMAPKLTINTLGWDIGGSFCAVYIKGTYSRLHNMFVPYSPNTGYGTQTIATFNYNLSGSLITWNKAEMQSKLEAAAVRLSEEFALDIARARDETFGNFPKTKTEWERSWE